MNNIKVPPLYDYQKENVEKHIKALDTHGASLDGSPCGAGKTFIASEVARRYSIPIGVLAPKRTRTKWEETLRQFRVIPKFITNPEKLRNGSQPEIASRDKNKFTWNFHGLLINDETHDYSGYKTLNSELLCAAQGMPVLMLSASIADSPISLRSCGYLLGLYDIKRHYSWCLRNGCVQDYMKQLVFDKENDESIAILNKIHETIYSTRGARVSEETLQSVLPAHMILDEPLYLDTGALSELRQDYALIAENEDQGAVRLIRLRQAVESRKIKALASEVEAVIAEDCNAVVFLNFHNSIDALQTVLGGKASHIDGRISHAEREVRQALFQQNQLPCLIVQIGAGGQSIDLHDTHGNRPRVQFICPQWDGKIEYQALGRAVRVGAKSRVITKRMYVPGTIEETVLGTVENKIQRINILNTGMNTTTDQDQERQHSKHSPSSLKEKAKCGHFQNDQDGDKTAALRGVKGHTAMEKENPDTVEDDEELFWGVKNCLKYLTRLRNQQLGPREELSEIKVNYLEEWGYFDKLILWKKKSCADLIDYKFAKGEYTADSPQFWAYCVGLFEMYDWLQRITVHVPMPFRKEIDVHTFDRKSAQDLTVKVLAIITNAENPQAPYNTGDHCRYCGNRAVCPALNQLALDIGQKYAPEEGRLVIPEELQPENITDGALIAKALLVADVMEPWAQKVKSRAKKMILEEGIEVPGIIVCEKKTQFRIDNTPLAWEAVKDAITPEAFAECVGDVEIGKLEKAVARVARRGEKQATKDALRDALIDAGAARLPGTTHYLKKIKIETTALLP